MAGFLIRTLLAFLATLLAGRYMLGGESGIVWMSSVLAAYTVNQMAMANGMPVGHGVNGSRHVLDMPFPLFCIYLGTLGVVLLMALTDEPDLLPATSANFSVLGLGLFFGWAGGIFDWYLSSSERTWYFSEFHARMAFRQNGFDEGAIDALIEDLRSEGKLPPKAK